MPNTLTKWTTHILGDLCDICRGSSPRPIADQRYFVDGTIPWIKIADATKSGKYLYKTKEHVNEFGASFSRYLPAGSLIIAASGTLGYPQMLGVKGCAHDGWLIPSNFRGIDSHFLYYYFLWKKEFFYSSAYGAAIQNINTMILKEMEVTIPSLPTQRMIASILSAYDDLIENNTRRIAILEEMAQAIYREWFVNFRFPGHENVKLVQSTLGMIPEGWAVVSLSSLMEIKGGTQPPKSVHVYQPTEGYVRLIQIRDYQSDKHPTFVPSSGKLNTCNERDIMIARYGASVARICLGLSGAYNVALTKVLPAKTSYRIFLKEFLTSDFFQQSLIGMSGRAAQNGFNKGDISAILLARTINDRLFDHFSEIGIPMESSILGLRRRNENLRTTRDLLLPKLISGQLDVEELDIDLGMTSEALEEATG